MLVNLLTHVDEVLPCHRIIDHSHTASLLVALRGEEGGLLGQVVDLFAGVGEHVAECTLRVVKRVHGRAQLVLVAAPLRHILASEQLLLTLVQVDALGVVPRQRLFTKPVGLLVALRFLAEIFEPCGQVLIDKLSRADGVISIANDQVRQPAVKLDSLWDFSQLHQLRKVIDFSTNCEVVVSKLVGP